MYAGTGHRIPGNHVLEIAEPSKDSWASLLSTGNAVFVPKPLSFDLEGIESHMKIDLQGMDYLEVDQTPPLSGSSFSNLVVSQKPTFVFHAKTGKDQTAFDLYDYAQRMFEPCGGVQLSADSMPDYFSKVKNIAFTGKATSGSSIEYEAINQYAALAMSECQFYYGLAKASFRKAVPVGFGISSWGHIGQIVSFEWIGVLVYSFISKPFNLNTADHKEAIAMLGTIASTKLPAQWEARVMLDIAFDLEELTPSKPDVFIRIKDRFFHKIIYSCIDIELQRQFIPEEACHSPHSAAPTSNVDPWLLSDHNACYWQVVEENGLSWLRSNTVRCLHTMEILCSSKNSLTKKRKNCSNERPSNPF
jgi:hypothetical protein